MEDARMDTSVTYEIAQSIDQSLLRPSSQVVTHSRK